MKIKGQRDVHGFIFLCGMLVLGLFSIGTVSHVQGQDAPFPSKPVEIIVPFGPGGIIDLGSRIFSESLSKELKVPVVIRNQAGGSGLTGSTMFFTAKPDGYTLLAASGAAVISTVQLTKTPPFDPRKDFLPLGYIADSPVAMSVPKSSPFKSFDDFLQFAKKNPRKLNGGTAGLGGENHMMFLAIVNDNKIETRMIPYGASGDMFVALLGGHVDWITSSLPSTMPYARSGDVRILLLTRRLPALPDVPSGPDIGLPNASVNMWMGLFAHSQTPKAVHDRLVSAVKTASQDAEMAKKLVNAGFSVMYRNPQEFSNLINEQWSIFARGLKQSGMMGDK